MQDTAASRPTVPLNPARNMTLTGSGSLPEADANAPIVGVNLPTGTTKYLVPVFGAGQLDMTLRLSGFTGTVPTARLYRALLNGSTERMNAAGTSAAVAFAAFAAGGDQRLASLPLVGDMYAILEITVPAASTATFDKVEFSTGATGPSSGGGAAGILTVAPKMVTVSDAFARPANATAYAAGNAVTNNAASGSVVALHFAALTPVSGRAEIQKIKLSVNAAIAGGLPVTRLHLFNISTMTKTGDGAAFIRKAADNGNYLGYVDIPAGALEPGAGTDTVVCVDSTQSYIVTGDASGDVWALCETLGAYTPGNAMTVTVQMLAKQLA